MLDSRRLLTRILNAGLILFGLAVVTVIGTGGTRLGLGSLSVSLQRLENPLFFLFFIGALRLLAARPGAGLEARLVRFYARQGMAPRHAPATSWSALCAGCWLGAGVGTVCGLADILLLHLLAPSPSPKLLESVMLIALGLLAGWLVGGVVGGLTGLTLAVVAQRLGSAPGRYAVGRWTVAGLLAMAPLILHWGPRTDSRVMLLMALATLALTGLVLLLVPAAVMRAKRGSWGLAIAGGGGLALLLALVAISVFAPTGSSGAGPVGHHPNLLLVTMTGVRTDGLSLYRSRAATTPNIDDLAHRGAYFGEMITPATETVAAAGSMLSGLYAESHGIGNRRQDVRGRTLPEMLRAHGYRSGAFVSLRSLGGARSGLADYFDRYDDLTALDDWLSRTALARVWLLASRNQQREARPASETIGAFRRWLGGNRSRPWLAWIELAAAARVHPIPVGSDVSSPPVPMPPAWAGPSEARAPLDAWLRGYAEAIAEADRAVGELREILRGRGELHRTVLVVTAEHGVSLGEGGVWFEVGSSLPEGVIHVPCLISGPGVSPGGRIDGPASIVDLAPTLLGMLGLGSEKQCEGEDLSRYVFDAVAFRRDPRSGPVFSESLPQPASGELLQGVRFGPWKLVRYPDGSERFLVVEDTEREILVLRGRQGRLRQEISDMLTRRLARGLP